MELELPLLTLRLELELLPLTLREELLFTLRVELELPLLTLRLEFALPLLTLRVELELPLLTLRLEPVLPLLTLRLELVLLGRSYVLPDWVDLVVSLLTEREELERLEVAGATLLTDDEPLPDCDTLRVEPEVVLLLLTLRLELLEVELLLTLRVEDEPDTLRLALEPLLTLRFEAELTLRPDTEPEAPFTDLDAAELPDMLTLRLLLEPDIAIRSVVVRLRLRSHPPPFILRFGVKPETLSSIYEDLE